MAVAVGQKLNLSEPTWRPCPRGCGAKVRSRNVRRICDECRVKGRRETTRRYRERRKSRADLDRPFLMYQHGMTEADYQRMLEAQGGRCAGCGRTPPIAGKDLHIDHDHTTCHPNGGRSCERCRRGLLCAECNMALGLVRDSIETLWTLATYLESYDMAGRDADAGAGR